MRLVKGAVVTVVIIFSCMFLVSANIPIIEAQGKQTPTAVPNVLFEEDFVTRANRWRLFNLGKAVINYERSALVIMQYGRSPTMI
jgi:hypothetical protein